MLTEARRGEPVLIDPALAEGLRWGLAAALVMQTFLGGLVPSMLVAVVGALKGAGRNAPTGPDLVPVVSSAIPWLVFLGAQLSQVRFLRRLGPYPYSDRQITLMALLPGYNLFGSVELFASQGEAIERLGAARGLGLELRAAAALASGLAVAVAVLSARAVGAVALDLSAAVLPIPPALLRSIIVLSLVLLLVRLYVLGRLQIATRALLAVQRAGLLPDLEPRPSLPGLPGARRSVAATGLALAAVWTSVSLPPEAVKGRPAELALFTSAPLARPPSPPAEAEAPKAVPAAPPRPPAAAQPRPAPLAGTLLGGRTVEWWRDRLRALSSRTDEDGQRLFELTRERAVANGLIVTTKDGVIAAEPGPDRIPAALAEVPR